MYKKIMGIFITISIVLVIIANYTFATTSTVESDGMKTDSELSTSTDGTVISGSTGGGMFENEDSKDLYDEFGEWASNSYNKWRNTAIEEAEQKASDTIDLGIKAAEEAWKIAHGSPMPEEEKQKIMKKLEKEREQTKTVAKQGVIDYIDKWKTEKFGTIEMNANNIADWARNKVGTTLEKGVDQIIEKAIYEPVSAITDEIFGEDSFLSNTLASTLTSYVQAKTEDERNKILNSARGFVDLPELTEEVKEKKENFDWAYEATNAALKEVNELAYELGDALSDKIEEIIGGDIGTVVGGYVEGYLDGIFKVAFEEITEQLREHMATEGMSEEEINEAISAVEEEKEQLEDKVVNPEKQKENAVKNFKEGIEKAINEQISQLQDAAYKAMVANLQNVAQNYVDTMFAKLNSELQVFDGTLGKIANSFIAGLTGQVKNWAGQNIKNVVKQYMDKWFQDATGEIKFDGLDFNWDQVLVDALEIALQDKNLALLISVGYQELKKPGGMSPAIMTYEEYAFINYIMMIRGGTLIPSLNNTVFSYETVKGLSPAQFNALTDSTLTYYIKSPLTIAPDDATVRGLAVTIPETPDPSPYVRPGDTTNTTARILPIWTTYLGGPVPYLSDAAYVMCEMDKNTPGEVPELTGDSNMEEVEQAGEEFTDLVSTVTYVQRALSYTSIYTGTKYNLTFNAANLVAEAAAFQLFTTNAASHGGYNNAIEDKTEVATGRYNLNSKTYILGPFKVDYIRDFIYTARGKAEFGLMVDMNIYDQNGNQIPRNYWTIIYSDDTKQDRREFDDDYKFPYPNEDFYIALSNYGSNGITSISQIKLNYRELQVLVKFNMLTAQYNTYTWFDEIIPVPQVPSGVLFTHIITASPVPQVEEAWGVSINYAYKYYLNHTQTITLHKKAGVGGYETAEFTTTSSTSISGTDLVSASFGGEDNSSLFKSIQSALVKGGMTGMYSSTGSKFFDSISQVYNIYNDAKNDTPLLDSLKAVLATYGKTDWLKYVDMGAVLFDENASDFAKIVATTSAFIESDNLRRVINLVAMYNSIQNEDITELEGLKYIAKELGASETIINAIGTIDILTKDKELTQDILGVMVDFNLSESAKTKKIQELIEKNKNLSDAEKKEFLNTYKKYGSVFENSKEMQSLNKLKDTVTPKKDIDGYAKEKYGKDTETYEEIQEIQQAIESGKIDNKLTEIIFNYEISDYERASQIRDYCYKSGTAEEKEQKYAAASQLNNKIQGSSHRNEIIDTYKNAPKKIDIPTVVTEVIKETTGKDVNSATVSKDKLEELAKGPGIIDTDKKPEITDEAYEAGKGPGIIETEDKTKISVLQASEDDAGLTIEQAARVFINLYETASNKDVFINTLVQTYENYEDGMSEEESVMDAYRSNPADATTAVSQFLDLIPHMTENELKSLTTAMTKASDMTDLTNIFATYRERQNLLTEEERKEFEARAFQETLEEDAVLYDDSIYTEYNPKFTITNVERPTQVYWSNDDEVGLTFSVAGVVWKDAHGGLENNYDGIRGANANGQLETGIQGVKVTLIDQETGEIGKYYDTRNNLVDCVTYTDEGGYYHFERIRVGKYDVEFEYDGQNYKTTELLAGGNVVDYMLDPDQEKYYNNSKAAEDPDERIDFNNKFYEIANGVAIGRDGTRTPLTYDKTGGVSKLVTLDSEGHVLPQFAMHARATTNGLTYPLDDNFTMVEEDTTMVIDGNQYTFYNTGEYMYHVNLGLVERSKIDLAITQDVYNVVTTVNQKKETYKYNARGILAIYDARLKETDSYRNVSYNRELYRADYEYRISDYKFNDLNKLDRNGDDKSLEIEKIQSVKTADQEEKVFVTYKLTLCNQSIMQVATVNEIVDYFDPTYRLIQEDYYLDIQDEEGRPVSTLIAPQSYYETSKGECRKITWTETGRMGTDYYPGLNTVYTTDLQDYMLKAGEEIYIYMTFEVEKDGNSALYLGQKQNIAEITNYSSFEIGTVDKTFNEGLIDKDSEPGNTNPYAIDEYEDDTDAAPLLNLKLYETDGRTIDGYVWDDDRTKLLSTGQLVGDGLRQDSEDLINGVRVQLVEKIDNPANGEEYEYVWKEMYTGSDLYSYVVNTGGSTTFGGEVSENGSVTSDTQMGAVARGQYKFNNYIAGNFIVRFIYGDTERTYLNDTEVEYSGEYAGIGQNPVSYNGQDYKSTTYQEGQNLNVEWYDLGNDWNNDKFMSDAKDDVARRYRVIEYSATVQNDKAEIMASFDTRSDKGYYDPSKHQALRDNTWMFADTARFDVKVEYDTEVENGLEPPTYRIRNVDFGLEQRPETKIELNKEIIGIKITLASGEVIIDTANGINKNVNWINKQKIGVPGFEYKRDTFKYRYNQGNVHIYMDEEVQQGANIEISYRITITNNSQIDYTGDGDLGLAYFVGRGYEQDKIVTTTVDKIIDYVDNSLVFREVDNSYNGWKLIETMPEFMSDEYKQQLEQEQQQQQAQEEQSYGNFIEQQMSKYGEDYVLEHLDEFEKLYYETKEDQQEELEPINTSLSNSEILASMKEMGYLNPDLAIVKTKSARTEKQPITQVIVTKNTEKTALKPGESTTVDLVLSKTLSPQDEADTLSYENMAEILQLSNTVGRRDMDALAGNQEPDEEPAEYDTDFTERVIITPPTGDNRAYYFVLGTVVLVILCGGIILIKRKVLNNK